jgi:uncharacterized protein YidB (DUF937 family)
MMIASATLLLFDRRLHEREDDMASRNMTALLAMLAMAGWQNRDRLGELLGKITGPTSGGPPTGANPGGGAGTPGAGGLGGVLGDLFGGGSASKGVSGGLGELVDSFTKTGHGEVADSWVQTGPNKEVAEPELADALGGDTIDELAKQTGLSREELLSRLKAVLPTAVDKLTPQGRLPTEGESSQW